MDSDTPVARKGLQAMTLKENLEELTHISTQKRANRGLVLALGLFGVALVVSAVWLSLSDRRDMNIATRAQTEEHQIVDSLMQPVQSLKRIMADEQVQALAARTVEDPENMQDLDSYLSGRVTGFAGSHVFSKDLSSIQPSELGANGYALYELALITLKSGKGLMQIHHALQPPLLHDLQLLGLQYMAS